MPGAGRSEDHQMIAAIDEYKEWLQEHLDELKAACPDDREKLNKLYADVTLAAEQSINAALEPGSQQVAALTAELDATKEMVVRMIERREDAAAILEKVSAGAGIVFKLASLVLPVSITRSAG
jgi:hypothetical protein